MICTMIIYNINYDNMCGYGWLVLVSSNIGKRLTITYVIGTFILLLNNKI